MANWRWAYRLFWHERDFSVKPVPSKPLLDVFTTIEKSLFTPAISWVTSRIPDNVVRSLSGGKHALRRRRESHRVRSLIDEQFAVNADATVLAATGDTAVFRIETPDEPPVILKVAHTSPAIRQLESEAGALDELTAMTFDETVIGAPGIAAVLDRGSHDGDGWFSQSVVGGVQTSELSAEDPTKLVAAASAALSAIHAATAEIATVEGELLERTVLKPLHTLEVWRPQLHVPLRSIRASLTETLHGTEMTVSRLHGDFGPANILWDVATETVTGLVDWSFHDDLLPPEIDLLHFAIALTSERSRQEYGAAVVQLLDIDEQSPEDLIADALRLGPNNLEVTTALTLAWLHHVSFGLGKQEQLRTNEIWLQRNVDAVAHELSARLAPSPVS